MVAETQVEQQSDAGSTKDTPYLVLMGELWVVFCKYFWENLPRYNGTALYHVPWTHIPESVRRNIALHANFNIEVLMTMYRCWCKMFIDKIDIYYAKTLVEIVIISPYNYLKTKDLSLEWDIYF